MLSLELNNLFNDNTYKRALILNDNNINNSLIWIEENVFINKLKYLTSPLKNDINLILKNFYKKLQNEWNIINSKKNEFKWK